MAQTVQERLALAKDAAYHSALISGSDTGERGNGGYDMLVKITSVVFGCETGALTHPLIYNFELCEDREYVRYRTAIRASVRSLVPDAKYVTSILNEWWARVEEEVPKLRGANQDECEKYAWQQHDFLVSLEPFADANGRTARIVYYMLLVSLGATVKVISSDKAAAYSDAQRKYRSDIFAPLMRSRGFIAA